MKRMAALSLLLAFPGCGAMPVDGTNPADSSNVVVACNTAYYNSDFGFGFDLPLTATFRDQGSDPAFLFDAWWFLQTPGVEAAIKTNVAEFPDSLAGLDDEAKLLSWADSHYESYSASPNTEFFMDTSGTLSNGDLGYMVMMFTDVNSVYGAENRIVLYEVATVKYNRIYWLRGFTFEDVFTDTTHEVLSDMVASLCVD